MWRVYKISQFYKSVSASDQYRLLVALVMFEEVKMLKLTVCIFLRFWLWNGECTWIFNLLCRLWTKGNVELYALFYSLFLNIFTSTVYVDSSTVNNYFENYKKPVTICKWILGEARLKLGLRIWVVNIYLKTTIIINYILYWQRNRS